MGSEHEEAEQTRLGEPAYLDESQSEDGFWEEYWLPEEDAVPPEPAWFAAIFEQTPLPPEPAWDDPIWGEETWDWVSEGSFHPSRQWQVITKWRGSRRETFVANVHTNQYVWRPPEAIMVAWSPDGAEVAIIREHYERAPDHPAIIGSPLQREFLYAFERYTWPKPKRLSACPIYMPTGWPIYIAFSPRKDMAFFQWTDQGEAGLEFIILSENGDYQLRYSGFAQVLDPRWRAFDVVKDSGGFPVMYNGFIHPIFSPTGRYIVVGLAGEWYPPHGYIAPSVGQASRVGEIYILDWDDRTVRQVIVIHEVSSDADSSSTRADFLEFHDLGFSDEEHVSLKLADGRVKFYHIYTDSSLVQ